MSEFPKWKYQKGEEPKLVRNADQEAALGDFWFDTPRLAGMVEDVGPENSVEKMLKSRVESKDAEIAELKARVENLEADEKNYVDQIVVLDKQVEALKDELETAQSYVTELEGKVENLELELEKASKNDNRDESGKFAPANDGEGEGEAKKDEEPAKEPAKKTGSKK